MPDPLFSVLKIFCKKGYFALQGVLEQPSVGSARIPAILYCVYQLMFAAITYVVNPSFQFLKISRLKSYTQSGSCHWCYRRTWSSWSSSRIHLRLEYPRLRSHCLLGVESLRLVSCSRRPRFCRWYSSTHQFWYRRIGHLNLSRKTSWIWYRKTSL